MNAVILAAGTGSRLQPYTINMPKALVPLCDKPLIEYQLDVLKKVPNVHIHLVTGYLAHCFDRYPFQQFKNNEYAQSNMLYSLMKAHSLFDANDDLLICYGDIIYQQEVLEQVLKQKGDVVVAADQQWQTLWSLRMEDPTADAESFVYDGNQHVLELGQPLTHIESAQAQYIGLIKITKHALKSVFSHYQSIEQSKSKNMYMTDFIQSLIHADFDVRAALHQRQWLEVDTSEDLHHYQQLMQSGDFERLGYTPSSD